MQFNKFPYTGPLKPGNAAAVVLTSDDGRYVMQCRDNVPGIFYPGHLGLFGGACEVGENYEQTAVRELEEELSLSLIGRLNFLTSVTLDFEPHGYAHVHRFYFSAVLTDRDIADIRVCEGRGFELIDAVRLLTVERVVPYDAFAIWMHCNVRNSQPMLP